MIFEHSFSHGNCSEPSRLHLLNNPLNFLQTKFLESLINLLESLSKNVILFKPTDKFKVELAIYDKSSHKFLIFFVSYDFNTNTLTLTHIRRRKPKNMFKGFVEAIKNGNLVFPRNMNLKIQGLNGRPGVTSQVLELLSEIDGQSNITPMKIEIAWASTKLTADTLTTLSAYKNISELGFVFIKLKR